jgi:phytoene dehydrogenase-like protein
MDRWRRLEGNRFDVVVVGAGIGGLTAAALLARRGRSVLVVDQHSVAGGNATIFRRKGYEFDVGIHYLGQCGPGGTIPAILRAAGAAPIDFNELDPDGFDTLCHEDFELKVPRSVGAYRERLLEQFPDGARAIDANTRMISQVAGLMRLGAAPRRAPAALFRSLFTLRHARHTLGRFLGKYTRDPRLVAVLAGESGDYALPPSRASALMHAGLMAHYLEEGAWYPAGGGQVMSDRLADSIEKSGGKILLLSRVTRILVENGQVQGVELTSKHLGKLTVQAPLVIANSDIKRTLLELLGPESLREKTRRAAAGWKMAPGLGVVYLGVRPEALGGRAARTNYWIYPSCDLESEYANADAGRFSDRPFAFISIASLKDPDNVKIAPPGIINLQVMGLAPSQPAAWGLPGGEPNGHEYRDEARYREIKERFAATLLRSAERVFPSLSRNIVFQEVATPITHTRYTLSTGGTSYGLAATPDQFLWNRPTASTEIQGLYLCGASTRSGHGIMGAMMSGLFAAAAIAGRPLVHQVLSGAREEALPAIGALGEVT